MNTILTFEKNDAHFVALNGVSPTAYSSAPPFKTFSDSTLMNGIKCLDYNHYRLDAQYIVRAIVNITVDTKPLRMKSEISGFNVIVVSLLIQDTDTHIYAVAADQLLAIIPIACLRAFMISETGVLLAATLKNYRRLDLDTVKVGSPAPCAALVTDLM
jgi:hypothetical protein